MIKEKFPYFFLPKNIFFTLPERRNQQKAKSITDK